MNRDGTGQRGTITVTIAELDPRLTFDAFVVGPANRLASAAARRAADSPGTSYNPLFIYSDTGLGKTHVLVAIAHRAKKVNPELRIEYVPIQTFLEHFGGALAEGDIGPISDQLANLDILLLDDVEQLRGQTAAQEVLTRSLDSLAATGGQVVLASNCPPSEIGDLDQRLVSRFSRGLIVDVAAPEYETRVAIVRKKIADLRRLERALRKMADECTAEIVPDCPIVDTLYSI